MSFKNPLLKAAIDTVKGSTGSGLETQESIVIADSISTSSIKADSIKDINKNEATLILKDSLNVSEEESIAKIFKRKKNKEQRTPLKLSSLQFAAGANHLGTRFNFENAMLQNRSIDNSTLINGFEVDANLNFKLKKIIFSAGINFHQWTEKFDYENVTSKDVNQSRIIGYRQITSYPLSYQNVGHTDAFGTFIVDTVIISLDTVITNESVTEEYTTVKLDTLKQKGKERYAYATIPFKIGYAFGTERMKIIPMLGGSLGIPTRSKSYYFSAEGEGITKNIEAPLLCFFEVAVDFQLRYKFLGFSLVPFYRQSLFYLKPSNDLINKNSAQGLKLGITYYLN